MSDIRDITEIADYVRNNPGEAGKMKEDIEVLKRCFLKNLFLMSTICLEYDDLSEELHGDIVHLCQDFNLESLMILVPRGMYKSSLITISYVIWRLCKDPNRTFGIQSYSDDKARGFLSEIAIQFESNVLLNILFGDIIPNPRERSSGSWMNGTVKTSIKWNERKLFLKRTKMSKTPSVFAFGERTAIESVHCHEIICDDPVTAENYAKKTARDTTSKKIASLWAILMGGKNVKRRMIYVGTRWCDDDLYSRIVRKELHLKKIPLGLNGNGKFKVYCRAAIEDGKSIHPTFDIATLMADRDNRTGEFLFAASYMNDPKSSKEKAFDVGDLCYWNTMPMKIISTPDGDAEVKRNMNYFILYDPASGEGDCDSVVLLVGITDEQDIYIIDYKCGKHSPSQAISYICNYHRLYNATKIVVETFGFQKTIKKPLREAISAMGLIADIVSVSNPTNSKHGRIMGMQTVIKGRRLYLNRSHEKLIDQIENYPAGLKDIIDVLSYIRFEEVYCVPTDNYDEVDADSDDPMVIENLLRSACIRERSPNNLRRNKYKRVTTNIINKVWGRRSA